MPLNKLENFIKNTEGRILYVNPNDLDATDSITNLGNSLTKPFKTIQRALLESARFSYVRGKNNDITEKTTILLFPGEYIVDNRPGYAIKEVGGVAQSYDSSGSPKGAAISTLSLNLDSNFDLTQSDNILYKFNSVYGGVVVPRGTSIVGLDLRKTKIRAKYIPNPTDDGVDSTAIFKITGACYFWQLSFFDGDETGLVYTDTTDFSVNNQSKPTFSHHKLTCFEYADGVNIPQGYDITDLDMYYSKLSNAYNEVTGREILPVDKFPDNSTSGKEPLGFAKQRPEWEIVGAFAEDPVPISNIISGNGSVPTTVITVTTATEHKLNAGTPIKINGVSVSDYNVSTKVQTVLSPTQFTYQLETVRENLPASPSYSAAQEVVVETDTVSGASPYVFNCSLRSVWGMNGMHADGSKASGFRSMVVAQFTGVSLQKDDRAFVKYNSTSRVYNGIEITKEVTTELSANSASTTPSKVYHLDSDAIYRRGWEPSHIKISNDAFIQIVSVFAIGFNAHFNVESGGDASITNSNSNFGQISLIASGFKKSSFDKDNNGYITSIITPKSIELNKETNVSWISLDVGLTTSVGISSHLYLYGFSASDDIPPVLVQGYRVGAKKNDLLYVDFEGSVKSSKICMVDSFSGIVAKGTDTSEKAYTVSSGPVSNIFTLSQTHGFQNGEKVRIISDDGDLPENIETNVVYYAITTGLASNQVKLASSKTNADSDIEIDVYGGSNLKIYSRCSDKTSGDLGYPIQYDSTNKNWFIHTTTSNEIYSHIAANGVSVIGERTPVSFIKRIEDSRSLDDKLYKVRYVIPQQAFNSRNPINGYILQESNNTSIGSDDYATATTIGLTDLKFSKNLRILANLSTVGSAISAVSELPHNLNIDDTIIVKNVKSDTNTTGEDNKGYNGSFKVTSIVSDKTFLYSNVDIFGVTHNGGTFTSGITTIRTTSLPRFERNDLQSNYFIYRSDVISDYIEGVQDGIYHLYLLKADNAISDEFTDIKYSQNVVDLYPQLDKDNIDDNPYASKSFAKRSPLGDVITNDLKKSITRETIDSFIPNLGLGLKISSVVTSLSGGVGVATVTFDREHGLNGITTFSSISVGTTNRTNGTFYNVKLFNNASLNSWNGATAKVSVANSSITSAEIMSRGSAYTPSTLYFDISVIGGVADATVSITNSGISSAIGDSIQITGNGTVDDIYSRITQIPTTKKVAFAITTGDPVPVSGQYLINLGPSLSITSNSYSSTTGITTFVTSPIPHGLLLGNKFTVLDSSGANLGEFFVKEKVGVNTFTAETISQLSTAKYIVRNGLSATNAVSNNDQENISVRGVNGYGNETLILSLDITTSDSEIQVSLPYSGIGTMSRFPLGSYIQVDDEIMRVSKNSLTGLFNNKLNVIRGVLGTLSQPHSSGSLIRKIKPLAVELRRPSISRASGHTFEYLGYGPGNYSTGLPQIQVKTLTEREDFLSQAQERSGGSVVYTGMNSDGDFFIGNTKYSSSSGTQKTFDIPIPTVTGEDPSRSSVIFDEVRVKERILVEGGTSNTALSQFDGPVTFNNEVKINDDTTINSQLRVNDTTQSTNKDSGAVIVEGGVGIEKNVNIGGNLGVTGTSVFTGTVDLNNGLDINFGSINLLGTSSATDGDIYTTGGSDGAFGIWNTTNSGATVFLNKNSGGTYNDILTLYYGSATLDGALTVNGSSTFNDPVTITDNLTITNSTSSTVTTILARGADGNFQLTAQNGPLNNASGQEVFRFGNNYSGLGWNSYLQFIRGGGAIDGSIAIYTNNSEALRIDSSRNVGIGIANPTAKLHVSGSLTVTGSTLLGDDSSDTTTISGPLTASSSLTVNGSSTLGNDTLDTTTVSGPLTANTNLIVNGNTTLGNDSTDTTIINGPLIANSYLSLNGYLTVNSTLNVNGNTTLGNDSTDTTTIKGPLLAESTTTLNNGLNMNSGYINLQGTSSTSDGDIYSTGGSDSIFTIWNTRNSGATVFQNKNSGGTYNDILSLTNSYAVIDGVLYVTNDIVAFYTSDERLKDNVSPIQDPLAKVISISGNTFDWNEKSGKEGSDVGVIAQEVQKILPEAVTERENGYLAVRYEKIIPLLIEAIKELSTKVESLEDQLKNK